MEKKKVNIGLDIGIASVGWSVVDTDFNIVEHGVRLFPSMDGTNNKLANLDRRDKRSSRRVIRRKVNLKRDFHELLKRHNEFNDLLRQNEFFKIFSTESKIYSNFRTTSNIKQTMNVLPEILFLRNYALKDQLLLIDLIKILYWYLSNRGFTYTETDKNKSNKNKNDREKFELHFDRRKYPAEMQSAFFIKNGYLKSHFNLYMSAEMYKNEITKILENQKVSSDFKEEFIDLFIDRRSYEVGPGPKDNEWYKKLSGDKETLNSRVSEFSRYAKVFTEGIVYNNIWEKTVGRCSVYTKQERIAKDSLSAELFNVMNEINNIYFQNGDYKIKLEKEHKIEVLDMLLQERVQHKKITSFIMDKLGAIRTIDVEGIKHEEESLKFSTLSVNKKLNKFLKKEYQINIENLISVDEQFNLVYISQIDQIINIFYKNKFVEDIQTTLSAMNPRLIDAICIDEISNTDMKISNTHSFSQKAIFEFLKIMLDENWNQMQILSQGILPPDDNNNKVKLNNHNLIALDFIDDIPASPTIKRSLRQTIHIINDLIKTRSDKYVINNIVIEMARETNSKNKQEIEKELNDSRERYNKDINKRFTYEEQETFRGQWREKYFLWKQQCERDAYHPEYHLDLTKVLTDENYTQIDHIIPRRYCFDNSRKNKVLTLSKHNFEKSNRSSSQYLGINKINELYNKYWEKWYLLNDDIVQRDPNKLRNLMDLRDYSNPVNSYGFILRNLVDTRYATKSFLSILNKFISSTPENHILHNVKTKTINGKFTSFLRKQINNKKIGILKRPEEFRQGSFDEKGNKNRDWNGHHAEDASLIVYGALKNYHLTKLVEKIMSEPDFSNKEDFQKLSNWYSSDKSNLKWSDESQIEVSSLQIFKNELDSKCDKIKYSQMLMKRNNTKIADDTKYVGKWIDGEFKEIVTHELLTDKKNEIKKLADIFKKNTDEFDFKYTDRNVAVTNRKKSNILMIQYDFNTFKNLKNIFDKFYNPEDETNPFIIANETIRNETTKLKGVPLFGSNGEIVKIVSKLRVISNKSKNVETLLPVKRNIDIWNGSFSYFTSLNWIALALFKDAKGKNHFIPMNALYVKRFNKKLNLKELIAKSDIVELEKVFTPTFFQVLNKHSVNARDITLLHWGATLQSTDDTYWRIAGMEFEGQRLQIWRIDGYERDPKHTINSKLKNWKIVETNALGDVFRPQKQFIF